MAPTDDAHGTQTAVIGTEHTLDDITVAGVYVLDVDLNAMASTDVVEIREYIKTLSGGTLRVFRLTTITVAMAAGNPDLQTPPMIILQAGRYTLKQTVGTGRAFPWQVSKVG